MPLLFFNDTATTEIYTLSLHDALPISGRSRRRMRFETATPLRPIRRPSSSLLSPRSSTSVAHARRSEEHTPELQSRQYLVCRLLLENYKRVDETRSSPYDLLPSLLRLY